MPNDKSRENILDPGECASSHSQTVFIISYGFFFFLADYGNDSSANMWKIYMKESEKSDKALAEDWKGAMEGTLIFVRPLQITIVPVC